LPEWLVIARREFIERVRTLWFVIVTVLGPIAMMALLIVPAWLGERSANEKSIIQVVDHSGRQLLATLRITAAEVAPNLSLEPAPPGTGEAELLDGIREKRISGFLVIPSGVLRGERAVYRGDNATNFRIKAALVQGLLLAAVAARASDAGMSLEASAALFRPIELESRHDNGTGQATSAEASFAAGFAVMFLLYMSILLYVVNVMRSVIQEKTSRVVEIVISAVKPRALMLGKVIGVGAVGLVQLGIWSAVALLLISFRAEILALFGITASSVSMPPLDLVDVLVILGYFALGYFFYAALYAAIGAMVNSDQEAQQVQTPVVLLLIVPVACVQLVANDPRGGAAQLLTMVPFSSPVLMPMRYLLGGATWAELGLSMALLLASIGLVVAVAARIYRVGILMYGKRPSLRELARWIRYS
jgi:ABC-2 type transport system permease protein